MVIPHRLCLGGLCFRDWFELQLLRSQKRHMRENRTFMFLLGLVHCLRVLTLCVMVFLFAQTEKYRHRKLSGILWKIGSNMPSWNERYFEVHDDAH